MNIHSKLIRIQAQVGLQKTTQGSRANYRKIEDMLAHVKPFLQAEGLSLHRTSGVREVGQRIFCVATAKLVDKDGECSAESEGWAEISLVNHTPIDSQLKLFAEWMKESSLEYSLPDLLEYQKKCVALPNEAPQRTGSSDTYAQRRACANLFMMVDDALDPDAEQEGTQSEPRGGIISDTAQDRTEKDWEEAIITAKGQNQLDTVIEQLKAAKLKESEKRRLRNAVSKQRKSFGNKIPPQPPKGE